MRPVRARLTSQLDTDWIGLNVRAPKFTPLLITRLTSRTSISDSGATLRMQNKSVLEAIAF